MSPKDGHLRLDGRRGRDLPLGLAAGADEPWNFSGILGFMEGIITEKGIEYNYGAEKF